MKRINEKSIDIDRSGDELILSLNIFNSDQYDLMNRRMKVTESIVELDVFNNSEKPIKILNPELVVYDLDSRRSPVKRYNSKNLQSKFPFLLKPQTRYQFAYNSKKMVNLLKGYKGEDISFQIQGTDGKFYESLLASGDDFETYIMNRDKNSNWKHKDVYEFDNEI